MAWDTPGGGPGKGVNALAWSADAKHLAAACENGVVQVFDASGKLERSSDAGTAVLSSTWSADNRYLAVGCDDGKVRVWGQESEVARVFEMGRPGVPRALSFDTSGEFLVAGVGANLRSGDALGAGFNKGSDPKLSTSANTFGAVVFIDLRPGRAGQPSAAYADALPAVSTLTPLPDKTRIAIGCDDRSIRFTTVTPSRLVELAHQRVNRKLSRQEWDAYVGKDLPFE
jgi:WD40 repeat protein